MPVDPDALRLVEALLGQAHALRFGQMVVEVTTRYVVDVRDGRVVAAGVKEVLPRVTIEQLRKAESESVIA